MEQAADEDGGDDPEGGGAESDGEDFLLKDSGDDLDLR